MTETKPAAPPVETKRHLLDRKVTPLVIVLFIGVLALFALAATGLGLVAQHFSHRTHQS